MWQLNTIFLYVAILASASSFFALNQTVTLFHISSFSMLKQQQQQKLTDTISDFFLFFHLFHISQYIQLTALTEFTQSDWPAHKQASSPLGTPFFSPAQLCYLCDANLNFNFIFRILWFFFLLSNSFLSNCTQLLVTDGVGLCSPTHKDFAFTRFRWQIHF